MSTFDAVMLGALGMAAMLLVMVAVVVAVWKVWPQLVDLTKSFVELTKLIRGLPETMKGIHQELAYMREMAVAQQPQATTAYVNAGGDAVFAERANAPTGPAPFPSPDYSRYPVAAEPPNTPEATLEDTDMDLLNQDDAELVAMENLEKVRQRSGIVEDSDAKHDAIIAESD